MPSPSLPTTLSWDANGNKAVESTGLSNTTYTWDPENRLNGVAYPDGTIETHTYSADGMRQKKVTSTGTIIYVRDGENVLIETNASLITQVQYTDFPGLWGGLASERQSGVSSFYGFDQQENARILVSSGGVLTDSYIYKAFGEELAVSGTTVNPFRFGGQVGYYRDIASRLYVRARHLDVMSGRWLSRPGFEGVIAAEHPYCYAMNSPVVYIDPNGAVPTKSGHQSKPKGSRKWRAGLGPGECPGEDAVAYALKKCSKYHACSSALGRHAGAGSQNPSNGCRQLRYMLDIIVFQVGAVPAGGAATTSMIGCDWFCFPQAIVFAPSTCAMKAEVRACALLWEVGNYSDCYFNLKVPKGERGASDITRNCNCPMMTPGGVH